MKNRLFAISIILMFLAGFAEAQQNGSYKISKTIEEGKDAPILFDNISGVYALPKFPYQVRSAKMYFTMRAKNPQKDFYEAKYRLEGKIGDVPLPKSEMLVTNNKDAHTVSVDVTSVFSDVNAVPQNIEVSEPFNIADGNFKPSGSKLLKESINLVMEIALDIEYKIDVTTQSITNQALEIDNKVAKFRWQSLDYAPNYQIQILRLYHTIQDRKPTPISIHTFINWETALIVETQTDKKEFSMTIGEGSGFYIWRVRPIGSFYENGSANPKNVGQWSFDVPKGEYSGSTPLNAWLLNVSDESSTTQISKPLPYGEHNYSYSFKPYSLFYYRDIDENINHIYTRVFTEKSGISEKIVYANTLGQAKQTQTYLESQKQTVTAQTIQSNTGAPVINTLPVPINENGLKGHKEKFVTPSNDDKRPYRAEDFDEGNKIKEPSSMSINGSDYYLGKNYVASAEGYMFSRALYMNDATGRVIEQSGVGKKHMIGTNANGKGKTTKMIYSSANEYELLRMFGNEAPNASSVTKVITEDPNGTKSIQYTSKEGKVLATCLLAETQSDLDALLPLSNQVPIKDLITLNQSVANKIVSSKSYYFPKEESLDLEYRRDCDLLFGAPSNELKEMLKLCEYELEIFVSLNDGNTFAHDISVIDTSPDREWSFVILDPNNLSNPINKKTLRSKKYTISCFNPLSDPNAPTITLPHSFKKLHKLIGNFTVEKQLTPKGANPIELKKLIEAREGEILPLSDMLTKWMKKIKCSKDEAIFYNKVLFLQYALEGKINWTAAPYANIAVYNDALHEQQVFGNPPTPTATTPNYASVRYDLLNNFLYKELDDKAIAPKPFFKLSIDKPFHTIKLFKYLKIEITTKGEFCNSITIPMSLSLAFDLTKIELVDNVKNAPDITNETDMYKINPFVHLDRILENNGVKTQTEFYPDLEGYSYGYLWDAVPSDLAVLDASIQNMITPSTDNKLYPYIKQDLGLLGGENIVSVMSQFKTKCSNTMHFPNVGLLNAPFIGDSEHSTQIPAPTMSVKEYLGLYSFTDNVALEIADKKLFYIHYRLLREPMNGWHTPGTFSLMVNKMLTDVYSTDGFTTDSESHEDRALIYEGPLPKKNDCGEENAVKIGKKLQFTVAVPEPTSTAKKLSPQYRIEDLLNCWEGQLGIVRQAAITGNPARGGMSSEEDIAAFLKNLDAQLGDMLGDHDGFQGNGNELNDELRGRIRLRGIARLFAGKKVRNLLRDPSQYFRMMTMPPSERVEWLRNQGGYTDQDIADMENDLLNMPFIKPMYQYHMVSDFLQCTGYKFAKITTQGPTDERKPLSGKSIVQDGITIEETSDFRNDLDTYYNVFRKPQTTPPADWKSYDGKALDRKYYPNKNWNALFEDNFLALCDEKAGVKKLKCPQDLQNIKNPLRLFENIFDPVYAFKYFDYARIQMTVTRTQNPYGVTITRQEKDLESSTSPAPKAATYGNPYRYLEIISCFENYKPADSDCYVCGIGKIGCVQTHTNWSAGQRYAFYQMLKSAPEDREEDESDWADIRAEELVAAAYYTPAKGYRTWTDEALRNGDFYKNQNDIPETKKKTFVQMELELLNKDLKRICEERRDFLREQVVALLQARCYEIVDCITSADDKKILDKDIDQIVEVLIAECKARGKVTSFKVFNAPCKIAFNFSKQEAYMPIAEYGTNGSVAPPPEETKARLLKRNSTISIFNLSDLFQKTNTILEISDGVNMPKLDIYDNTQYDLVGNLIKSVSSSQTDSPNIEWLRREQALGYKMSFDMPCKCPEPCKDITFACSVQSTDAGYHSIYTNGALTSSPATFEANLPNHNPRRWFLPSRWHIKPQKPKQTSIKTIKIVQTN
jgi:hypothetical protein